jgi:hypothetical protein
LPPAEKTRRARLAQRSDEYLILGSSRTVALHGADFPKPPSSRQNWRLQSTQINRPALGDSSSRLAIRQRAYLFAQNNRCRGSGACITNVFVNQYDIYATPPNRSTVPFFRIGCGDVWLILDAANGAVHDRLDSCSAAVGRSLALCTGLIFWFCRPPIVVHVLGAALCALRFRFSVLSVSMASDEERADCQMSPVDCQMFLVD